MSSDICKEMWKAMSKSPYLMVALEGQHMHAQPMTAQLDEDADGCFWFYTRKDNRLAAGGPAMAQFVAKGHDVFACISGRLVQVDATGFRRYDFKQREPRAGRDVVLTLDARRRYAAFCAREPQLAERVPLLHLASYLGITDVSLSRIRRAGGLADD